MPLVDPPEHRKPRNRKGWAKLMTGHLPLEHETAAFILVNVLDFFMTYLLLSSGRFVESNPVGIGSSAAPCI